MNNLKLLEALVSINSVFPNEKRIGLFIIDYLKNLGFRTYNIPTTKHRTNIVAEFGRAKSYLGFYSHLDTVPVDKNYQTDPFVLIIKNKKAYGLGVADMKGGIVAVLKTAEFASRNNLSVKVVFGVDEEGISKGAHDLVDSKLLDNISFLIVGESGQIKNANKPFSVVLGRKGRVLFDIEIFGKKVHAAESEKGINAIEQAVKLIDAIKKINFPRDKNLGKTSVIFQEINAQTDSFSLPDYCLIRCSLLTNSLTKSSDFADAAARIANRLGIKAKVGIHSRQTPYGESYCIDINNLFLKKIVKKFLKPNGVRPIYTSSIADENVFANRLNLPVLTLGPIGGNGHIAGEWLDLNSLRAVEEVYIAILKLYHS